MTVKENPVTIVFKHQGEVIEALVLANKGICWQVELSDGSTTLVQKKHVISESTQPPAEFHTDSTVTDDPFEDEPLPADSLASMLTKIRADGKVSTPKKAKATKQPATPAAKPDAHSSIISLKALCAELNIEPRIARRRLRNSQGHVGTGQRWEWEAGSKELAAIRTAIKG